VSKSFPPGRPGLVGLCALLLGALAFVIAPTGAGSTSAARRNAPALPWAPDTGNESVHETAHGPGPFQIAAAAQSPTPTPNQASWDALFYSLDLDLNPTTRTLTGTVTVRARVLTGPLTTLQLDLHDNMNVVAARCAGLPAPVVHSNNLVTITLNRSYAIGQTIEVAVDYNGSPYGGWFNFDTHSGQPMIWNISEAFGARSWWPCKDAPEDKADSVDIRLSVPSNLIAASNGRRVQSTVVGGKAITLWHERYPIATYLVSVAVHPYVTYSEWWHPTPFDSMEIAFYMYPDDLSRTTPGNALVRGMLDYYSGVFGMYPFRDEKYGHAQFPVDGGMEHQTIGSLGNYTESVVAHELAHQWWGDLVTCRDFRHFWLNEGFATYAEGLWYESKGGASALREDLSYNIFFGSGTVYIPNLDLVDSSKEFELYYNRASWVLHMLRHVLGDAGFFASLTTYRAAHAYGTATTDDFQAACEQATGRNLDRFFDEWVRGERYPEYRFDWSAAPSAGGYDVTLTIQQRQAWQIFSTPIDVRVVTNSGPVTFVVADSLPTQVFVLHTTATPVSVMLDPDDWMLKTAERPVTSPSFDRGTLVVNGVSWDSAGVEIRTAYQEKAFWGDYPIDFWDVFPQPASGYPGTLPAPLGHGEPTREVLGHYRNVVWVSDHRGGDLSAWLRSPIPSYLETGGNLILLTRLGTQYVHERLRDYLGIQWVSGDRIHDYVSTWPGLTNLNRTASMSFCALFDLALERSDSHVIYKADFNYDPDRGVGVWRKPSGGGTHRPSGGQFVFLSGRPQYWVPSDLRTNITTILRDFFGEPTSVSGVGNGGDRPVLPHVGLPEPNPTRGMTRIELTLPVPAAVEAVVVDVSGRRIRSLASGARPAGTITLEWNGRNDRGISVGAGVYWVRVTTGKNTVFRRVVLVS
jgi:aminopeptidase N